MQKINRKDKKKKKKFKIYIFTFFIVIILSVTGYFVYSTHFLKNTIISPIAFDQDFNYQDISNIDKKKLEERLKEKRIDYKKIEKNDNSFNILLENDSVVTLSRNKDLDLQIASLQFIITRLTMDGRTFSSLDLRFDKPVIREK